MKFSLADRGDGYIIHSYRDDGVIIGGNSFDHSLVVLPNRILADWRPRSFKDLEAVDFTDLKALNPDLVVLGTGPQQRFPNPSLYQSLTSAGIGLEIMSTPAACRTYNVLVSEGRRVAAALLFD